MLKQTSNACQPEIKTEKLILASASTRRKRLLKQIGLIFDIITPNINETLRPDSLPSEIVTELARMKAEAVAETINEPAVIIAADTVVSLDDSVMGKPADENDAVRILTKLSGKKHVVYTGVEIIAPRGRRSFVKSSDVYMRNFTDSEARAYISTGEPFDKAGAYGIQGVGALFVEKINGDFFNVMGLPIADVFAALKSVGAVNAANCKSML
ncbi:MAG: Maf family protein [Clostridiales bacterium]|jgi:septum formation protein|nr:Maf family protein [Clostridiales bacterium]